MIIPFPNDASQSNGSRSRCNDGWPDHTSDDFTMLFGCLAAYDSERTYKSGLVPAQCREHERWQLMHAMGIAIDDVCHFPCNALGALIRAQWIDILDRMAAWLTRNDQPTNDLSGKLPAHQLLLRASALKRAGRMTGNKGLESEANRYFNQCLAQLPADGVMRKRGRIDLDSQMLVIHHLAEIYRLRCNQSHKQAIHDLLQTSIEPFHVALAESAQTNSLFHGAPLPNEEKVESFKIAHEITGNELWLELAKICENNNSVKSDEARYNEQPSTQESRQSVSISC